MKILIVDEEFIAIKHLTKKFGSKTIFDDFEVTIPENSFTCVMGPNGSGKTTLLKIIAGLEPFQDGVILVGKRNSLPDSSSSKRNRSFYQRTTKIGFVFQEPRLLPWKNVLDNVTYGLKVNGVSKKQREEMGKELLTQFGLESVGKLYPRQLSGGMKQKVNIARALIISPDVLLLDEPFNNLDVVMMNEVSKLLQELRKDQQITVIMVNHYLELSSRLSDRIIFLDGRNYRAPRVITRQEYQRFDHEVKHVFQELRLQAVIKETNSQLIVDGTI